MKKIALLLFASVLVFYSSPLFSKKYPQTANPLVGRWNLVKLKEIKTDSVFVPLQEMPAAFVPDYIRFVTGNNGCGTQYTLEGDTISIPVVDHFPCTKRGPDEFKPINFYRSFMGKISYRIQSDTLELKTSRDRLFFKRIK